MTGPKTNEGATAVGERVGTRATAKYVRGSATKARQVLDLIRGQEVQRADDTLALTERDMGQVIRKVLASAVANAEHNDSQGRDELYVAACFADEGPTLRRFRPRARGRATRIRKRTCHITVVVARLSDEELDRKRRREDAQRPGTRRGRGGAAAPSRRDRVARSRQAAQRTAADIAGQDAEELELGDEVAEDVTSAEAPYGPGSHAPLADGSAPEGYEIKGNEDSMLYHEPGTRFYDRTDAEVWFATEEAAEAAGFSKPPSQQAAEDAAAEALDEAEEDEAEEAEAEEAVEAQEDEPEEATAETEEDEG
jgi:large subunit ribosomal protein L22